MACDNDADDNYWCSTTEFFLNHPMRGYTPAPLFLFNSFDTTYRQFCMIFSIDEMEN